MNGTGYTTEERRVLEVAAGAGYLVEAAPGLVTEPELLTEALGRVLGLGRACTRRVAVITDSNVGPLYAGRVAAVLEGLAHGAHAGTISIPAGEPSKTPAVLVRVLEDLAAMRLTRSDAVIAIGGGVVGDLAGLAAALYMRGIDCLQIPTSLLAMVDSSVGGKTAVDLEAGKNLMGVFSQPVGVLVDPLVLKTLPPREVSCGWGEIIKYAGIDEAVRPLVRRELLGNSGSSSGKSVPLPGIGLICAAIDVKRRIVAADEKESGCRKLLNYGHTVGHAVETASRYRLSHGAAVGIGMHVLMKALAASDALEPGMLGELEALLTAAGLPVGIPAELLDDPALDFRPEALLDVARHDKKSAAGGVSLILPAAPGRAEIRRVSWPELEDMIRRGL